MEGPVCRSRSSPSSRALRARGHHEELLRLLNLARHKNGGPSLDDLTFDLQEDRKGAKMVTVWPKKVQLERKAAGIFTWVRLDLSKTKRSSGSSEKWVTRSLETPLTSGGELWTGPIKDQEKLGLVREMGDQELGDSLDKWRRTLDF